MSNESNAVAETILLQFGGARRLGLMTGAHSFLNIGEGLRFKWRAPSRNGAKVCTVRFDAGADLYTVEFATAAGRVVEAVEGVFAEDLIPLFEHVTGLALRMPRVLGLESYA
jgi:hypothetical protein